MYSGEYEPALKTFNTTADLSRRTNDHEWEITSLNNIGTVRYFTGRYSQALEAYQTAAALVDSAPDAPWLASRRQLTLANTAILFQTLGQYDRALTLYNELLNSPQALSPREQAQLLANVGVLRRRLGDPLKALDTYRTAQALYRRSGHRDGEIAVLNNIGILQAMDLKDYRSAVATFTTALQEAEESEDRPLTIHSRLYRGEAYFRDNRLKESAADFQAAAVQASAMGAQEEEWKAEFGLARIALREKDAASGKNRLRRAVRLIESMRANLASSSLRSAFLADKRGVYDLLIENSTDIQEIFTYMEQSRARGLADRLEPSRQASLESVSRLLPDDTALLEYWIDDSSFAVLWVSGGKTGFRRSSLTSEDRHAIAGISALLADAKRADWIEALRPIARKLLADIPPLQDPRTQRLVIVPDGSLSAVPFEALPMSQGLLIDRFTISYLPASGLILPASAKRPIRWFWQPSFEAFADPVPSASKSPEPLSAAPWSRLPGARHEIDGIANAVGGRAALYYGSAALKARLLHVSGAPILHFATHAFADLDNPDLSYILLAPASSTQRYDYLFLKEVGDLPLSSVGLVTLSACETGIGKDLPGEGVQSFTRSFLAAGVPSVVTSLWAVPDQTTAQLMVRFYSRLAQGATISEALRGAKLEMLHSPNAGHPSNWAAFVVNGDGAARVPYVIGRKWLLLPIAALLAIVFGFRKRAGRAAPFLATRHRSVPASERPNSN